MVGAYVDQSKPDPRAQSFTGEENRIKSQRAMANMLRGKEAPKGKTVGPYDLYMGPNWGDGEPHGHLALEGIRRAEHRALGHLRMGGQHFLHPAGR